jgi:hypothetical protein
MKRDYDTGVSNTVQFFFGKEVEHTPAFGKYTLFVVGVHTVEDIKHQLTLGEDQIGHIFFGANHSFNPQNNLDWQRWESMIESFLDLDYLCSLDIPMSAVEEFNENGLNERDNFIPQIRVPIPYVRLWNYNTMIKIDDTDFKATNPGVWSHYLHDLQSHDRFTDWSQYKNDKISK